MNYFKELLHQKGSCFICNLINVNAQLKNTDFVGEGRGVNVAQDPSASCHMRGQSMGLAGQGRGKGSGSHHPVSPKLRQPRHRFNVGLKSCRHQRFSPKPFIN